MKNDLALQLDFLNDDQSEFINEVIFNIPYIIKYMGSKKPILDFVTEAISEITNTDSWVCDLFSGSCSVSALMRRDYHFISNDIQCYSKILAHTYFSDLSNYKFEKIIKAIKVSAEQHTKLLSKNLEYLLFNYSLIDDINEYQKVEASQRCLYEEHSFDVDYHLFTKYYSGTYWSFEQCIWIDSLRKVADDFRGDQIYYAILSSIMHAMSYTTQSTGHFAQYRDGNTDQAVENIISYRQKSVFDVFSKKLDELLRNLGNSLKELQTTTFNYEDCLKLIPEGSAVYCEHAALLLIPFWHTFVLQSLLQSVAALLLLPSIH